MKTNRTVLIIVEIAILSSLSLVLDYLANFTTGSLFVSGGSISIAMVPIMLIGFRRGIIAGIASGFIVGVIQVIYGGHILEFFQYIFDYPLAYTVVGLAGVFIYLNKKKINGPTIVLGSIFAGLLRYLSHILAGIIFWSEYVPAEFMFLNNRMTGFNAYTWSIFYNGLYMIPSIIVSSIVLYFLFKYAKQLFIVNDK
jgi:thiamine transporter